MAQSKVRGFTHDKNLVDLSNSIRKRLSEGNTIVIDKNGHFFLLTGRMGTHRSVTGTPSNQPQNWLVISNNIEFTGSMTNPLQ